MEQCSDCGKDIPEDDVIHCLYCDSPLCEDCQIGGLCSNCLEILEAEEDLEREKGYW